MDPTDLAYAAGIIDGTATIYVTREIPADRPGPRWRGRVRVPLRDGRIAHILASTLGGRHTYSNRRRPRWLWQADGPPAAEAIARVRPYLVAKREQADLFVEFFRSADGARRDAIHRRLHAAKFRGVR